MTTPSNPGQAGSTGTLQDGMTAADMKKQVKGGGDSEPDNDSDCSC